MNTRETIENYFAALQSQGGWDSYLADDLAFALHSTPVKRITGCDAYLESTKGFYGMITSVQVRDLLVDGNKACALTQYQLQSPSAQPFTSDVAEVFNVKDGQIDSLSLYFDSAPYHS